MRRLDHENIDSDTLFLKRPALRLAFLLVIAAAAFAATAGSAAATKSCGNKVIDDWYGSKTGQLSTIYPLHCYSDALKLIQGRSDIDIYSNARQDILLAMQQAIAAGKGDGGLGPPDLMTADVYPSFLGGPDAKYGGHAPPGDQPLTIRPRTINNPGPISKIFQGSSASSVPLPAIVLGAIAALLLALGLTAYLARRRQLRRQTFRPQAESGPRNP